jgi:hypothetical protein
LEKDFPLSKFNYFPFATNFVSVEQKVSQRTKTFFPRKNIKILRYREHVALLSLLINSDTHKKEICIKASFTLSNKFLKKYFAQKRLVKVNIAGILKF